MLNDQYVAFMTGGMTILVAAALAIAWIMWRERDSRIDSTKEAIRGVGHEYRINVQRMLAELYMASRGELAGPSALLPVSHPQLDGVNAGLIETNRKALATINDSYLELASRKELLRAGIVAGESLERHVFDAQEATIEALATLYLWEKHKGSSPHEARSTRSWEVRDWMKHHRFPNDAFPERHLRDEVVERLRQFGMTLTPKPLTHTAHEYYSLQYDRYADPRSPFGRRKTDEDGNIIRPASSEKSFKLPSLPFLGGSKDDAPAELSADDVRANRLSKLKAAQANGETSEGGGRFSLGGLMSRFRGSGDEGRPQGD